MARSAQKQESLVTAWQEQVQAAEHKPWLLQQLTTRSTEVFPRFARYYSKLRALPRKTRRALQSTFARSLAGAALVLALSPGSGLAALIEVNSPTDQLMDDNECTLREAVISANTNPVAPTSGCVAGDPGADTITFAYNDTYMLTLGSGDNTALTGDLDITEDVMIMGNGEAHTIIDGNQLDRVLDIRNRATVTIEALTIQNGSVNGNGGGIRNGGSLTLREVTLTGNTATGGSSDGGGVFSRLSDQMLTIENSTVSGNIADRNGGGMGTTAFYFSTMTLTNSTVSGNTAEIGGGMGTTAFYFSTVMLTNSTVSGNTADRNGGGMGTTAFFFSTVTLTSSTVSGNSANGFGGGVYSDASNSSTSALVRSLVAGNTAPMGGAEVYHISDDGDSVLTVDANNVLGHDGLTNGQAFEGLSPGASDVDATSDNADITLSDILETMLADNGGPTQTHALVANSPALDRVACGLTEDQRGYLRDDGLCDSGAVEYGAVVPGSDPCAGAQPTDGCRVDGVPNQVCEADGSGQTVIGTSGNDVIIGGSGDDVLIGQQGDDLLCGADGDDVLRGGPGADELIGGSGEDTLLGQQDDGDELSGGDDDDTLRGGSGNDTLDGGAGDDLLLGEPGDDTMNGGEDNDLLRGGGGDDIMNGDGGDDELRGETNNDTLDGGPGADTLHGGGGTDTCTTDGDDPATTQCE